MCARKFVLFLIVSLCCASLFALPQFGSAKKTQPTEATIQSATETVADEPESVSENSATQPKEEQESKGFLFWGKKTEQAQGAEDLATINDLYDAELENRDSELDAVEGKDEGMRFAAGLGTFTHFYADEPLLGVEGYVGIQKGSWTLLGGVGYEDALSLGNPKKEDLTGKVLLIKAF
jgi:hypothetical protein